MNKKFVLYLAVGVVSVIWGLSFLWSKIALAYLAPMQVLATRWLLGALTLVLLAAARIVKVNFKGKPLKPLAILTLLQPCTYSICEMVGIDKTTASESAIMVAMIPLVVLIISSLVYHSKIKPVAVAGILLAFAGVICTTVFSPAFSVGGKAFGYICLLGAVLSGALFSIRTNHMAGMYTPLEITTAMTVVGAVFFNAIMLAKGYGFEAYVLTFQDSRLLTAILFMGFGCTALCYLCYNIVVTQLPPHIATTLQVNLVTLVGAVSGIVFGGDHYGLYTAVGLIMIVTGLVITGLNASDSP